MSLIDNIRFSTYVSLSNSLTRIYVISFVYYSGVKHTHAVKDDHRCPYGRQKLVMDTSPGNYWKVNLWIPVSATKNTETSLDRKTEERSLRAPSLATFHFLRNGFRNQESFSSTRDVSDHFHPWAARLACRRSIWAPGKGLRTPYNHAGAQAENDARHYLHAPPQWLTSIVTKLPSISQSISVLSPNQWATYQSQNLSSMLPEHNLYPWMHIVTLTPTIP